MDGRIMRRGVISSCQSAATFEIIKSASGHEFTCKQRYSKYQTFTFIFFTVKFKMGTIFTESFSSRRALELYAHMIKTSAIKMRKFCISVSIKQRTRDKSWSEWAELTETRQT